MNSEQEKKAAAIVLGGGLDEVRREIYDIDVSLKGIERRLNNITDIDTQEGQMFRRLLSGIEGKIDNMELRLKTIEGRKE